ncbi:hypothetical protein ROSI111154_14145 [Rouxiella silvae]
MLSFFEKTEWIDENGVFKEASLLFCVEYRDNLRPSRPDTKKSTISMRDYCDPTNRWLTLLAVQGIIRRFPLF